MEACGSTGFAQANIESMACNLLPRLKTTLYSGKFQGCSSESKIDNRSLPVDRADAAKGWAVRGVYDWRRVASIGTKRENACNRVTIFSGKRLFLTPKEMIESFLVVLMKYEQDMNLRFKMYRIRQCPSILAEPRSRRRCPCHWFGVKS